MKLLSAPRQPFVGLALMAAVGIIVAEVVPVRSTVLILVAIVLAICILVALRWPKLAATYLIVAAGFFSAAQIRDNEHLRPATRGQTWRAAARRHSSRMRDH